jgi:nucleoside-diphosphate kinase
MDRTFVMVKPDGVQRGLAGEIISRFEAKGLKLVGAKLELLPEERVVEQYREHLEKPFFLMAWEGKGAVAVVRRMVGATNPAEAAPGSIRGDFALDIGRNVIHASDSPESAVRELGIHFEAEDLVGYSRIDEPVLYE